MHMTWVTITILFTGKITTPILQVEELRLKEVIRLVEAHTAAQGGVGTRTPGFQGQLVWRALHYCQEQLAAAPGVGPEVPQSSCICIVSPAQQTPITSFGFTCEELSSGKAEWKFRDCGFKYKFYHVNHKQKLTRYFISKKDLFEEKESLAFWQVGPQRTTCKFRDKEVSFPRGKRKQGEGLKFCPSPFDRHRVFQFLPWIMFLS